MSAQQNPTCEGSQPATAQSADNQRVAPQKSVLKNGLRLATWNVLWRYQNWQDRQEAIDCELAALDADVICLQETWHDQTRRIAELFGAEYVFAGRPARKLSGQKTAAEFGNAIISKLPIVDYEQQFFDVERGLGYRGVVAAIIDVASATGLSPKTADLKSLGQNENRLLVATTHLQYQFEASQDRQAQLKQANTFLSAFGSSRAVAAAQNSTSINETKAKHELGVVATATTKDRQDLPPVAQLSQQYLAAIPKVFCGDFNSEPNSLEIRRLLGKAAPYTAELLWEDTWQNHGQGPGETCCDTNAHLAASNQKRRIDYIFTSASQTREGRPRAHQMPARLQTTSIERFGLKTYNGITPSDHYGLVANFSLTQTHQSAVSHH